MTLPAVANARDVTEADVNDHDAGRRRRTAYFVHPSSGAARRRARLARHLRPASGVPADGQAARRVGLLGAGGQSVLSREESADGAETARATPIADVRPLAQALSETTHMTDAKAFIAWLDQQPSVAKNRKIGTQGYCMGGPIAFRTAAAVPDRVGAVASFHGGGLVTDAPNSPHLQAAKTKAQFLVAIAENDDKRRRTTRTCSRRRSRRRTCRRRSRSTRARRTAGARRTRRSTTSRRPRRRGPPARAVRESAGVARSGQSPLLRKGDSPRGPGKGHVPPVRSKGGTVP